jgi:hypothetical protein
MCSLVNDLFSHKKASSYFKVHILSLLSNNHQNIGANIYLILVSCQETKLIMLPVCAKKYDFLPPSALLNIRNFGEEIDP